MTRRTPRATIGGLFLAGGPTAIVRLIISVIVFAVDSFAARWWSHVGKKVFKTVSPAFANLNAARAVVGKTCVLWILATIYHHRPHAINPCPRHAMFFAARAGKFAVKATARLGVAVGNVTHARAEPLTAIANKDTNSRRTLNNVHERQPSEFLSSIISMFRHVSTISQNACFSQAWGIV